jgi:hypothetical protein
LVIVSEVVKIRLSKYFRVKGRCQICGRLTFLNKKGYCMECWIEAKKKAGVIYCLICGKRIAKRKESEFLFTQVCDECRVSSFKRVINNPELAKYRKGVKIEKRITDETVIRDMLLNFVKEGNKRKKDVEKFFDDGNICKKIGFRVLKQLTYEGLIKNTSIPKKVGGTEKTMRIYSVA